LNGAPDRTIASALRCTEADVVAMGLVGQCPASTCIALISNASSSRPAIDGASPPLDEAADSHET